MKTLGKVLCSVFLIFSFFLFSSTGWSQTGGTLKGKVIDLAGKFGLPTVQVVVIGTSKSTITNTDGTYIIQNIPPGAYSISFELSGYIKEVIKDVAIKADETFELNASLQQGFAHEVTVTARRAVTKLQEVPLNVEVITSEELVETPIVNIHQALDNVTGVDLNPTMGINAIGSWISINGYDNRYIKQMVDGVEVTGVVESWTTTNTYSDSMIDQIEVIKGGSSSAWGSNMGGIINYVTKRPKGMEKPKINLSGAFSSFGEWDLGNASANPNPDGGNLQNYSFSMMGSLQKFGYLFGIKNLNHDGFVDYADEKTTSLFGKIGYDFSDRTYMDLFFTYNKLKIKQHMFLETDPGVYSYNYLTDSDVYNMVGYAKFKSNLTKDLDIDATIKYYKTDFEWILELPDYDLVLDPSGFIEERIGAAINSSYRPSLEFSLVAGMDYYRTKMDVTTMMPEQPVIYVSQLAPYINAEYRLGNFGLHAGLRYDYDESFGSQLSPSVGANINLFKATLFRVNIARTFRTPPLLYTMAETFSTRVLPNPDLLPERSWNYSVGFESQELRYLWAKFSIYLHKMTDGIGTEFTPEGREIWNNLQKFTRKGYEAELGVIAPFGLTAYIGTNYNKHEQDTIGGESTTLIWIPTRSWKAGLKYKNNKLDFLVNLRARWIWWNMDDEFYQSYFDPHDKKWIVDLKISKGFNFFKNTRIAIFLDLYNLFDELYWDRKDSPTPRRWMQIGFELGFN